MDSATKVSLLAVLVALATAFYAIQEARKANRLTVLATFLKEYRDLEPERHYILNGLSQYRPRSTWGIAALPPEDRNRVMKVAYYLDALAFLVDSRLIDEGYILKLLGGSIQRQYSALAPFIEGERGIRGESIFMLGFENLARLAKDKAHERTPESLEYAHLRRFS